MGFVMKADSTLGDAYAAFDFPSDEADLWVTFDILIPADTLALAVANFYSGVFAELFNADTATVKDSVFASDSGSGLTWRSDYSQDGTSAPVADSWHTIELHATVNSPTNNDLADELFVNGVSVDTGSFIDPSPPALFQQFYAGFIPGVAGIVYLDNIKVGTTRGGTEVFSDDFESGDFSAWTATSGDVSIVADPIVTHAAYSPTWRFIVTNLEHETTTFLDPLAHDRQVTVVRNAPRTIHCAVPSDNPEVNILFVNEPFVAEGVRFLLGFRREGKTGATGPWVIRASTLIMELTDSGDEDQPVTRVVGYDPWKYLYRRPVLMADGTLPDQTGRVYPAGTTANDIIVEQFGLAEAAGDASGSPIFIDYGQTAFYDGTIETTDPFPDDGDGIGITFQGGTSLGEMLDTLVATGTCDVVLDPIYDPFNRPGILVQLSIYQSAGEFQADAILGWDSFPKNVVGIDRAVSGIERANSVKFFAGQGGPPTALETDAASLTKYGDYLTQQFMVGIPSLGAAHDAALQFLSLQKDGQVTYQVSLAAQRAPRLFEEYRESDTLPVYASKRLRKAIPGDTVKVEQIPIIIGDNESEHVDNLLVSFVEPGT